MGASASSSRRFSSAPAAGVDPRKEKYKLHRIGDHFTSVEQVQGALRRAGVESCNLIVGIDLTKSNECALPRQFCYHTASGSGDARTFLSHARGALT